jgi:hypothetical protein
MPARASISVHSALVRGRGLLPASAATNGIGNDLDNMLIDILIEVAGPYGT